MKIAGTEEVHEYECTKCGTQFSLLRWAYYPMQNEDDSALRILHDPPQPAICPKCRSLYVKWTNYKEET